MERYLQLLRLRFCNPLVDGLHAILLWIAFMQTLHGLASCNPFMDFPPCWIPFHVIPPHGLASCNPFVEFPHGILFQNPSFNPSCNLPPPCSWVAFVQSLRRLPSWYSVVEFPLVELNMHSFNGAEAHGFEWAVMRLVFVHGFNLALVQWADTHGVEPMLV